MREPRLYTTSADYAYQELRHRIITKQLKPGQRLPEVNIAVQMGVSRTPVREALRRLASEGLVIIIPNSGARLAAPQRVIKERPCPDRPPCPPGRPSTTTPPP